MQQCVQYMQKRLIYQSLLAIVIRVEARELLAEFEARAADAVTSSLSCLLRCSMTRRLCQFKSPSSGPGLTLRVSLCLADALASFNLVKR